MKHARNLRLPLVLAATLGILAACDVSDSPDRTDGAVTTTFAPRIQAPAGGVRQATFVVLEVWSQSLDNKSWDSVYREDLISSFEKSIEVKNVPLRKVLKFRMAGYVISFPNDVRTVDTVWTAVKENFSISSTTPQTQTTTFFAKNWAVAPTIPYPETETFRPGNTLELPAPKGYRLAWSRTNESPACDQTTAADTLLRLTPLVEKPFSVWIRSCSTDPEVLPSSPRFHSWNIDTIGVAAALTPLAPVPSGLSDFADRARIRSIEAAPSDSLSFGIPSTSVLAWNVKLSSDSSTPGDADYAVAPASAGGAQARDTGTVMDLWSSFKDSLSDSSYSQGVRVAVTLVRIDQALGQSWVSEPTRFWFRLTPPPAPTRFALTATRWDSLRIDWALSSRKYKYTAWWAEGPGAIDPNRATRLPPAALDSSVWSLGGLPPATPISVLLAVEDTSTRLVKLVQLSAPTLSLPDLPRPSMKTANTLGAKVKQQSLGTVEVTSVKDIAGRSLSYLYAFQLAPDTTAATWPTVPAVAPLSSADGKLNLNGLPGQFLFLTVVTTDSAGNRSLPLNHFLEIVANDVDVPPDAPTGLQVISRTDTTIRIGWDHKPGYRYLVQYALNGQGKEGWNVAASETTYTITGLKPGDSLREVSVQAIDATNASRISPFAQPGLVVGTRRPPDAPEKATARWVETAQEPVLRISWKHVEGTTDEIAWAGVDTEGAEPGSPGWKSSVRSEGLDSIDLEYSNLPASRFLVIGVRATRDSIQGKPVWTPVRIPVLAPNIAERNPRIWQKGDSLKIALDRLPVDSLFAAKIRIEASGTSGSELEITSHLGGMSIRDLPPGSISGTLWFERRTLENISAFDRGPNHVVTKEILPAPQRFSLRPGETEKAWIFSEPTDAIADATILLVRDAEGKRTANPVETGDTIFALPDGTDSFRVVQIFKGDTSRLSDPRMLTRLTAAPRANIAPGAYLFPFPITLYGTGIVQYRSSTGWTGVSGPLAPFPLGEFKVRSTAEFAVSTEVPMLYSQVTNFNDKVWGSRVAKPGTTRVPSWVFLERANATYVAQDRAAGTDAYFKVGASSLVDTATIWFGVDSSGGGTMSLANRTGIVLSSPDSLTPKTTRYFLKLLVYTGSADLEIRVPGVVSGTEVGFAFSGTTLPVVASTGQSLTWANFHSYVKQTKVVGVAVARSSLTSTLTPSMNLSGLRIESLSK